MPFPTARNKEAILSLLSLPSSIPFLVILKKYPVLSEPLKTICRNLDSLHMMSVIWTGQTTQQSISPCKMHEMLAAAIRTARQTQVKDEGQLQLS